MAATRARGDSTRTCVVTKEKAPEGSLFRLELGPEGEPFVDLRNRSSGRGVYVRAESLAAALAPKALGKTFRGRAKALGAPEIEAVLTATKRALDSRLLELVGLARRAGKTQMGVDMVVEGLAESGGPVMVVMAEDVSARSTERIETAISSSNRKLGVIRLGSQSELGRAVGREKLGVLLVSDEIFRSRLEVEAERRSGLEQSSSGVRNPGERAERIASPEDARKSH